MNIWMWNVFSSIFPWVVLSSIICIWTSLSLEIQSVRFLTLLMSSLIVLAFNASSKFHIDFSSLKKNCQVRTGCNDCVVQFWKYWNINITSPWIYTAFWLSAFSFSMSLYRFYNYVFHFHTIVYIILSLSYVLIPKL